MNNPQPADTAPTLQLLGNAFVNVLTNRTAPPKITLRIDLEKLPAPFGWTETEQLDTITMLSKRVLTQRNLVIISTLTLEPEGSGSPIRDISFVLAPNMHVSNISKTQFLSWETKPTSGR